MFRYVRLKNYRSLIDFKADLLTKKNTPQRLVLIYGENGVGKSNFAESFYTLCETMRTRSVKDKFEAFIQDRELSVAINEKNLDYIKKYFMETEAIIKSCKTNDSTENMALEFGFRIKGHNGVYYLETDDTKIVSERLEFAWNKNQTTFFEITENCIKLNKNMFKNSDYQKEVENLLDKYWGKHSLLSLIAYEIEDKKQGYVKNQLCTGLMDVILFFLHLSIQVKGGGKNVEKGKVTVSHRILMELDSGSISVTAESELDKAESFLNEMFTSLYSDIKQVFYKRSLREDKLEYQLYFKKLMFNKLVDVNFEQESTGTIRLLQILPLLVSSVEGDTVIIDEMDTGIHDLLIDTVLENLYDSIKGQFIITTHNTMLLESDYAKNSVYIFNVDQDANKVLLPLSSFEDRVHPNLNLRKRYLKGLYGGIPIAMDVDFCELASKLK